MYFKKGVSIKGLKPEMMPALIAINNITGGDFTITGGTEPHPDRIPNSLHPKGLALDLRIPSTCHSDHCDDPYWTPREWVEECNVDGSRVTRCSDRTKCLQREWKPQVQDLFADTDYDLVFYDTHLHIEYDPK